MTSRPRNWIHLLLCLCLAWAGLAQGSVDLEHTAPVSPVHESHTGAGEHCPDVATPEQHSGGSAAHGDDCTSCPAGCATACAIGAAALQPGANSVAHATAAVASYTAIPPTDIFPDAHLRPPRLFS